MKILIIGLGSIAKKHVKAIFELEPESDTYALRSTKASDKVNGVTNLYDWDEIEENLDFVIISNPTNQHFSTVQRAVELGVPLFIEKPPFQNLDGTEALLRKIHRKKILTYTAFNMRFLPVLQWLKKHVEQQKVIEVQVYCGSYLPDWRPGRDYRNVYSAREEWGGGVHLDLIHELDYTKWIFGEPEKVTSFLKKISDLEISSVDCAHYVFHYENMIATILLNYYRKDKSRRIEIVMEGDTWYVDLLKGTVKNIDDEILFQSDVTIADTYKIQMDYFMGQIKTGSKLMNNLNESTKTLKYCI